MIMDYPVIGRRCVKPASLREQNQPFDSVSRNVTRRPAVVENWLNQSYTTADILQEGLNMTSRPDLPPTPSSAPFYDLDYMKPPIDHKRYILVSIALIIIFGLLSWLIILLLMRYRDQHGRWFWKPDLGRVFRGRLRGCRNFLRGRFSRDSSFRGGYPAHERSFGMGNSHDSTFRGGFPHESTIGDGFIPEPCMRGSFPHTPTLSDTLPRKPRESHIRLHRCYTIAGDIHPWTAAQDYGAQQASSVNTGRRFSRSSSVDSRDGYLRNASSQADLRDGPPSLHHPVQPIMSTEEFVPQYDSSRRPSGNTKRTKIQRQYSFSYEHFGEVPLWLASHTFNTEQIAVHNYGQPPPSPPEDNTPTMDARYDVMYEQYGTDEPPGGLEAHQLDPAMVITTADPLTMSPEQPPVLMSSAGTDASSMAKQNCTVWMQTDHRRPDRISPVRQSSTASIETTV
ncbi:Hypp4836 [Branchiostoma lanceolatum]|uniref:Hypp4836 protein n=1 Tax=Branchiostoma lanceolatum TaxID=7740 RepID=A0A8K0EXC9_BRALA|nr:Hypp4836 [Branchiostoma lanceolatum]